MNTKYIISLVIGVLLGSGITYFIIKPQDTGNKVSSVSIVDSNVTDNDSVADVSEDPFGSGGSEIQIAAGEEGRYAGMKPHGYGLMDMKDGFERDLCISFWYLDMTTIMENLEIHTGHRFKKQGGKIHASPVEILEEQAAFMKAYLAESKRLSNEKLGKGNGNQ